jgi:hypothetical protein
VARSAAPSPVPSHRSHAAHPPPPLMRVSPTLRFRRRWKPKRRRSGGYWASAPLPG